MTTLKTLARKFWKDEEGLETLEYAILLGVIVALAIATIAAIGAWSNRQYTAVNTAISSQGAQ